LAAWPLDRTTPELATLSAEGQKLIRDGCRDPLIVYLATSARWEATEECYATREEFLKVLKEAEELPGPKALARLIACDFLRVNRIVKLGLEGVPQRLAKLTLDVRSDDSYSKAEDSLFLRHLLGLPWRTIFEDHAELIWNSLKEAQLRPWVRQTLLGTIEVNRAWRARGGGYADTVTPEGWKGFYEHLAKARTHLVKAWGFQPGEPFAPTSMISVTMGGDTADGETPRLWFDRAIAAQCDFQQAYQHLSTAWLPRWGGSNEQLVELASACLGANRFDTDIPIRGFDVLSYANADEDDLQLYRLPDIAPIVSGLCQGLAAEPTRAGQRKEWQARLAVLAWWTGDHRLANTALRECQVNPMPRGAVVLLHDIGYDELGFRSEVAILNTAESENFLKGKESRFQGEFARAAKSFAAAAGRSSGMAADRLRALAAVADFEAKLATGEWVKIPQDPSLAGWIQRRGSWFSTDAGLPAIKDADGPVRIVYDAHIGADFELRGSLKLSGEPPEKWAGAIIFGDQGERLGRERWHGAFVRIDKGQKQGTARCFFRNYVLSTPAVKCPWKETNEFLLRLREGKLTWSVNGVDIHKGAAIEVSSDEARIGIGSFRHFSGVTVALENLEVRRLDSR
jgi:hypothetical protein